MAKSQGALLDLGLLVLRVLTGLGMAYHGYGKVFGGHMEQMAEGLGKMGFPFPLYFAWAASLSEFVGGILLALGLFTPLAALSILVTMGVAFFVAHKADPFQAKELAAAYGTASLTILLTGPGALGLDRLIRR